jgi:hypothetical protein
MIDPVQRREAGQVAAVPRPPGATVRPGPAAVQHRSPGPRRSKVREALEAALRGTTLGGRDRQFLSRLVHWDKRNAAAVASLLWRARLAGRAEVALTARQMEIVLTALQDAAAYRASGATTVGCWDCENIPGGRCADHARDADRARACAELAAHFAAGAAAVAAGGELERPTHISGFLRRTSVAS